ncbi:MAG TPA: hypothetical protein VGO86_11110 [Candidatus Dormibacteraeota bacterium]
MRLVVDDDDLAPPAAAQVPEDPRHHRVRRLPEGIVHLPWALPAVNRHVRFIAHATTFEVAETEVDESHL